MALLSSILYLNYFNATVSELALFTVVNKVANLFFVVPMFFQSFVPVVLASHGNSENKFNKLLGVSSALAGFQLIFFIFFGDYLGAFFGVNKESIEDFYRLGLILSLGILFLNLSRPLSTFLMVKYNAQKVMVFVFLPTTIFALVLYAFATKFYGVLGAASAASITYFFMSIALTVVYIFYKKRINND